MSKRKYKLERRRSKSELKYTKSNFKQKKKEYKVFKKQKSFLLKKVTKERLITVDELDYAIDNKANAKSSKKEIKKDYKTKKKLYKRKYSKNLKKEALVTAGRVKTEVVNQTLRQDDDLGRYANAKQEYSRKRYALSKTYRTGKKVTKGVSKVTFEISNRSYNKLRGRGFTRTPEQFSLYNRTKQRIMRNKAVQKSRQIKNNAKRIYTPFSKIGKNIFKNPFKLWGIINLLVLLFIISLFISSISPANMNERNMNDTWLYFTKLDRENSNSKVTYYSNIEDYIHYLNYRYDKTIKDIYGDSDNPFSKKNNVGVTDIYKKKSLPETSQGREYLEGMWDYLNKDKDKDNLKTIDNLMVEDNEYGLDEKELKEYKELLKISNEVGKFPFAQELSNFLYDKKDENYNKPLKIIERYGYKDKENISDTTTFVAEANQYLYASMTGTVTVNGNNVVIEQGTKRITYQEVENIRVVSDSQVLRGEMIGQVTSSGRQKVKYEKLMTKEDQKEWQAVNIGFYLPKVEYIQKTEVIKDFNLDNDKLSRIREFAELVKKYEPNATNKGIAAALGNFSVESNINPKRAEGDFLPAPIGVVDDSSWDNPEWLDIGGVQIYNGRYPNIIRRGLGLGQWTDTLDGSVRHTLLRDFANSKNTKWYYMDLQVDFMFNGDSPYYINHLRDIVVSDEDVEVLTRKFLNNWEGNPSDKLDNRIDHAKSILQFLEGAVDGQPLENMEDVIITSDFGASRSIGNYSDVHDGVDLVYKDGRTNARVYSVGAGEVVWAKADAYGGLGVIVKHEAFYSYYWHLNNIEVHEGDIVTAGTYLGNMGSTGLSTGVHLHLGFSRDYWSAHYDPKPYLNLS